MTDLLQLVIRGRIKKSILEDARTLHNETAGNPQGVAAARALGDLSHNVFVPLGDDPKVGSELLFLDTWNSADGMQKFFSDPQVQGGANLMFETRDPVIGIPADIYSVALRAPKDRPNRYIGLIRGTVKSREAAKAAFDNVAGAVNTMRMSGLVRHEMFFRASPPGQPASLELIGIDTWHDAEGMTRQYESGGSALYEVFDGKPAFSVWKQPAGLWVEW